MNTERSRPKSLIDSITPITDWNTPNDRFYESPSDSSKVIRWTEIDSQAIEELPYVNTLLNDLEDRYHIPSVHPQYVVTGKPTSPGARHFGIQADRTLITISERITDAIGTGQLLEAADDNESIAAEFDDLSVKMLRHLGDVVKEGGVYAPEFYRFSQFVYSPSQPEGNRLILVDVEPIHQLVLPKPSGRILGSAPADIMESLAYICQDILELEAVTETISNAQLSLRHVISEIDSAGSHEMEAGKLAIITALERSDASILDFILEYDEDEPLFGIDTVESSISLAEYIKQRKANGQEVYRPFSDD